MTVHQEDQPGSPSERKGETAPPSREKGISRKKVAILFFGFFLLLWAVLYLLNREILRRRIPDQAADAQSVIVQINLGSSLSDIASALAERHLVRSQLLFTALARVRGTSRHLKAGEYEFERSMSLLDILNWLEEGRVILHKFTIPEGATVEQVARLLSKKRLADSEEVLALAQNKEFIQEMGLKSTTLEGYLFPDTYKIVRGLPARQVVRIMVDRFWEVWKAERANPADSGKIDIDKIIKIASVIEKEAIYDEEEFLISSVIYNRLRLKMPLQCDVTIRYPLDNYGMNLTYANLRLDSPYNSYLHRGLPPTPICNPGRNAIRAALNPPKTDYLYFVSMNNGHHKFSTNLKDHNKAVYKYQILNEVGK